MVTTVLVYRISWSHALSERGSSLAREKKGMNYDDPLSLSRKKYTPASKINLAAGEMKSQPHSQQSSMTLELLGDAKPSEVQQKEVKGLEHLILLCV